MIKNEVFCFNKPFMYIQLTIFKLNQVHVLKTMCLGQSKLFLKLSISHFDGNVLRSTSYGVYIS